MSFRNWDLTIGDESGNWARHRTERGYCKESLLMILLVDNPSTDSMNAQLGTSLVISDRGFGSPRHEMDYRLLSKDSRLIIPYNPAKFWLELRRTIGKLMKQRQRGGTKNADLPV